VPDLPPPVPVIEFSLASRGMSKGLAQTNGPQALVRAELGFGRVYVGGYAKNVDSSTADGEAGASLGVRASAGGFDLAANATLKLAIDPSSGSDAEALELGATAARKLGRLTPRLSVVWSPDDLGGTRRTVFAEAGASYRLASTLTASAAAGRRERGGGPDYTAWNAGLAWNPAKPITLDARYYDTDGGDAQPFRARGVVTARVKI
jgi:hypothetical protein